MSNLSTLQTLVNWANAGVIISLALSFVFGAASILLGSKLGKIKDAQAETAQRNLELAVSTQQERAANAERELLEVKERTKARGMTDEQLAHLREFLAEMPRSAKKVRVEILRAAHRFPVTETSEIYANQLAEVIQEAGFEVSIVERPESEIPKSGIPVQWFIFGSDNPALRLVSAIQGALIDFGIPGVQLGQTDAAFEKEELVRLVIGLNP